MAGQPLIPSSDVRSCHGPGRTIRLVNILGWIVVGLIAGGLAIRVTREGRRGCLYSLVIGVLGALIGGALSQAAGGDGIEDFSWRSLAIAFLGACLLLLGLQAIGGRRGTGRR